MLGAYQVDAEGSFANWQTDGMVGGGIGGAMDLVASGRTVMVMMEHRDSRDRPKVVQRCSYALTGKACVDILVTDLAQFRRKDGTLAVEQVAPGFTKAEVLALTGIDGRGGPAIGWSRNRSRERRPACRTSTVARRRSGTPSRGQGFPC